MMTYLLILSDTATQMPCFLASPTNDAMPFSPYSPSAATVLTYVQSIILAISTMAKAWKLSGGTTLEKYSNLDLSDSSMDVEA